MFKCIEGVGFQLHLILDVLCNQVDHDYWVYFKEVEIPHSWVQKELAETRNVDLVTTVKIEVAGELVVEGISNSYTVVVKDVSQVCCRYLGFSRFLFYLLYKLIIFSGVLYLLLDTQHELL